MSAAFAEWLPDFGDARQAVFVLGLALQALALAAVAGLRVRRGVAVAVGVVALVAVAVRGAAVLAGAPDVGWDFDLFWKAGRHAASGGDPYAGADFYDRAFLNPPSAVPLFELFAAAPRGAAEVGWFAANFVAAAGLVWAARAAVAPGLPAATAWLLTAAVATSEAISLNADAGQLGTAAALALALAVAARRLGRPGAAGVLLGLATVKAGTLVPFLLLLQRRADRATWLALAATAAGLCLLGGPVTEQWARCGHLLDRLAEYSAPGATNDFATTGPFGESIVGLDHLAARCGVADRTAARLVQVAGLAALCAAIGVAARRGRDAAAAALAGGVGLLFLYHRLYDAGVLALPLVYAADRARLAGWPRRGWSVAAAGLLFGAMAVPRDWLYEWQNDAELGAAARAALLPAVTWLTLGGLACLGAARGLGGVPAAGRMPA